MRLHTICLLALIAVAASPVVALSDAGSGAASASGTDCAVSNPARIAGLGRGLCKAIRIAQARQTCIQTCRDTYNGGEPLQTCIKQCPAE